MNRNSFPIMFRQSGAWSPLDIDGCVLWLDACQITGLSDGDPVATWPDASGLGYDAIGAGSKPDYKINILNGLPVVRWPDNTTRQLVVTDMADAFSGISEGTLFVVFAPNNDELYGVVEFTSAVGPFWRFSNGDGYFGVFRANRVNNVPAGQPTTGWHYHTIRSGPVNLYDIRRDGSLDYDGIPRGTWGISTNLRVGMENVANQLCGDIAEIILYARELDDDEVATVEANIPQAKWGL